METTPKDPGPFLLGLTGGIASGKTTVAHMLQGLGAALLDFDIVARQVVAPRTPAYQEILDTFGKGALQQDGLLDRKRLSQIVFSDAEKRKELERITHPRIFEAYSTQVDQIAATDPRALVLVVVPLLVEFHLQGLFHKVLVVWIPREKQIERLVKRDQISREHAANILKAQMPIDEKLEHADYVIRNHKSVQETEKQVAELWQTLQAIR